MKDGEGAEGCISKWPEILRQKTISKEGVFCGGENYQFRQKRKYSKSLDVKRHLHYIGYKPMKDFVSHAHVHI